MMSQAVASYPRIQKGLCVMMLALFPLASMASFDVFDEGSEGYYGNAETRRFKDDVEGTEVLSDQDRAFLNSISINRITERWYIRALVGNEKTKMQQVTNNSSSPFNHLVLSSGTVTKNLMQLLVAGGYLWEHWAVEGELFFSKQLNYNQTLTIPLPYIQYGPLGNYQLQSQIQQIGLLVNVVYVIPRYFDFYPQHLQLHLDAGVGPNLKSTNTKSYTTGGRMLQSGSARTLAWMGKLAAGGRYQFATHWLVDVSYAYLYLGKTEFGPVGIATANGNVKFKSNQMQSNGFWFGLTYQI